ncbi:TPA: hypothetical protein DIV55_05345 [Patescibacteria group bacterium]|uniref:Uncharacterized protein n=1 Tax=Candidatus Gottesmanbacteria bacterium GW2011_GWA1_43_11 TaxID=1618436 RepID=A0A0G1CEZ0_9BACT|nr:MAG: hypothetical protein UV59_C0027G0002 [Candidatus Gottesmanbacteria bacterium GW2011_GWA1_43_11]HCS79135.1 hypothetical protein [Patescibacteria group bacterium]
MKHLPTAHTSDAYLRKAYALAHATETFKLNGPIVSSSTDSSKRKEVRLIQTTDIYKLTGPIVAHATDATKRRETSLTHAADASKKRSPQTIHTVDTYLRKAYALAHATETYKLNGPVILHATDTSKRKEVRLIYTTNTSKFAYPLAIFTTDASKRKEIRVIHSTDAFLIIPGESQDILAGSENATGGTGVILPGNNVLAASTTNNQLARSSATDPQVKLAPTPEFSKNTPRYLSIGGGLSIMLGLGRIATWNTSGRPANPKRGTIGLNTELKRLEIWNGSFWYGVSLRKI